jgi:hypothetical protein
MSSMESEFGTLTVGVTVTEVASLRDGQLFSLDGYAWYACALPMPALGIVAVYAGPQRGDEAPTVRWPLEGDYQVFTRKDEPDVHAEPVA